MSKFEFCPACGEKITGLITSDFYYCPSCSVAVRMKDTIAPVPDRMEVYSEEWVKKHSANPIARSVAMSMLNTVKQHIGKGSKQKKVMDIGCGSGVLVDMLSRHGYDGCGLDWSEHAISFARKNHKGSFYTGNITEKFLEEGKGVFDAVIISHILEHVEEPDPFLESLMGLLKPDGKLFIAVPNLWWHDQESKLRSVSTIFDPEHIVGYSPNGVKILVSRLGYDVISMKTKTHKAAMVPVVASAVYRYFKNGVSSNGKAKSAVTSDSVITKMAGMALYPVCRMTERYMCGMELTVVVGNHD